VRDRFAGLWLTGEPRLMPRFGRRRSRNRLILPFGAVGILALGAPAVAHRYPASSTTPAPALRLASIP
jgi:hypothetical protein